jgi:hypothetical protein
MSGWNCWKAGDVVLELINDNKRKVTLIVMVDAEIELEGEDSGYVVEGVGAAIGGVDVEKFKIESLLQTRGPSLC